MIYIYSKLLGFLEKLFLKEKFHILKDKDCKQRETASVAPWQQHSDNKRKK